jgi:hypothetical protein
MNTDSVELNRSELMKINGRALWPAVLAGAIIAAVAEIIGDWDNFKNGLAGRPEVKK